MILSEIRNSKSLILLIILCAFCHSIIAAASLLHRIPLYQTVQNGGQSKYRDVGQIENIHLFEEAYDLYAPISIGTPGQVLNIAFALNTANFWITSSKCFAYDGSCARHRYFNSTKSTTYKANGTRIELTEDADPLSRNLIGVIAEDIVEIGGLKIKSQPLIEAISISSDLYDNLLYDGVLGLAFPKIAVNGITPVFQNMIRQNLIRHPVFSLYISSNEKNGSQLILGGSDPQLYKGNFSYVDIISNEHWQVPLNYIQIGSEKFGRNISIRFDNSLRFVYGGIKDIYFINKVFNGTPSGYSMSYEVNCTEVPGFPDIKFVLNGLNLTFTPSEYIYNYTWQGKMYCITGFQGSLDIDPQEPVWIFGKEFLRKFYTLYDFENKRMGFAQAV